MRHSPVKWEGSVTGSGWGCRFGDWRWMYVDEVHEARVLVGGGDESVLYGLGRRSHWSGNDIITRQVEVVS